MTNGLKIQWIIRKAVDSGSSGTVFTFPVSFSSTGYSVVTGIGDNTTNNACFLKSFTQTSVTVFTSNSYGSKVSLIVIGY